jgi:plasmid stabilization system protein ParE
MSSLAIERSSEFDADVFLQFCWYRDRADEALGGRYVDAVEETLDQLALHPGVGMSRRFQARELQGLRSFRVNAPFARHLIFYGAEFGVVRAVRIMAGERDLARRLQQPPGAG